MLKGVLNQARIFPDVPMADHDAFRRGCRTGSILQKGEGVFVHIGRRPEMFGLFRQRVRRRDGESVRGGLFVEPCGDFALRARIRQDEFWLRVLKNHLNARKMPFVSRGIRRNSNRSGIEASEKCGKKIQPRRIEQHHPFFLGSLRL